MYIVTYMFTTFKAVTTLTRDISLIALATHFARLEISTLKLYELCIDVRRILHRLIFIHTKRIIFIKLNTVPPCYKNSLYKNKVSRSQSLQHIYISPVKFPQYTNKNLDMSNFETRLV